MSILIQNLRSRVSVLGQSIRTTCKAAIMVLTWPTYCIRIIGVAMIQVGMRHNRERERLDRIRNPQRYLSNNTTN